MVLGSLIADIIEMGSGEVILQSLGVVVDG